MKTTKQKMPTVISIILMSTIAFTLVAVPLASAQHNPGWDIPTFAFINAAPDPVGVGQKVNILVWLDKPRRSAALSNDYRMHNYNLTIVDSAGAVVVSQIWETVVDTTSSQYYGWTPSAAGEYTLYFTFPGFYAGDYPSQSVESNDTYLPSSAMTTVTVQEEPLPAPITSYPLPQEYWTRPIYGENSDWWSISSNWLGTGWPTLTGWSFSGGGIYRDPLDGVGPQTGHIMWTKPLQMGGVVGGTQNTRDDLKGNTWFEGSAYSQRYTNPIIVAGMLIYNPPVSFTGSTSGPTTCVDLRTGEVIWQSNDLPTFEFAYIYDVEDPQQHGVYPAMLVDASGSTWHIYDAWTGTFLVDVVSIPSGTQVGGPQGEQLRYVISNAGSGSNPDYRLLQWNSSKLWTGAGWSNPSSSGLSPSWNTRTITTTTNESSITYVNGSRVETLTPVTTSVTNVYGGNGTSDAYSRYDWNVSIPWRNGMSPSPSVVAASYDDVMLLRQGTLPGLTPAGFGPTSWAPYTYFAVNLNASRGAVGSVLWTKEYTAPPGNITVVSGIVDFNARVFTETYKETRQHVGYSLVTGERLWTTESQVPMDYYGNPSIPWVASLSAYGNLYSSAYGGVIYCYDLQTGALLWTYGNGGEGNSTNAGQYLAYGNYPTFIGAIGSGMVYAFTAEHTVNTPIYKGALARGINATTGEEVWTLSNYDGSFFAISYAIADGYATFFNGYDNQIYVVGRGPSKTTVNAPLAAVTFGSSLVISGTVTDIAAGTQQDEQAARFPNGVPVMSDASMADWMGYVYQQRPRPTDVTGVNVVVSVFDSNNNFREIGTVTTDANGFFNLQWMPDIEGKYTVYARFAGTNAYWPSQAVAAFAVDPAPTVTPPPEVQPDMSGTYVMYAAIAIIVTIVVVGIAIVLVLRKR